MARRLPLALPIALALACGDPEPPPAPPAPDPEPASSAARPDDAPLAPPPREGFEALHGERFEWLGVEVPETQVNPAFPTATIRLRARAEGEALLALDDPARSPAARPYARIVVAAPGPRELPPRPEMARICPGDVLRLQVPLARPAREWVVPDPAPVRPRPRVVLGPLDEDDPVAGPVAALSPHLVEPQRAARDGADGWSMVRLVAREPGTARLPFSEVEVVEAGAPVEAWSALTLPTPTVGQLRPGDVVFLERSQIAPASLDDPMGGLEGL